MKTKTSKFWLFFAFLMLPVASQAATFSYSPLEKIPGSDTVVITDFYTYVQAIYKFGIWAVGIAALLMITIGAYMYITSAGNNTSMEKAKSVISDAIIGLILALLAYLLLYVINPDLLTVQRLPNVATGGPAAIPPTGPAGAGNCQPATSGPCSPTTLQASSSCFGSNLNNASAICLKESGNSETAKSGTDKCTDGNSVSIGLFQINLTNHTVAGVDCSKAFTGGPYTGSNHNCTVTNQSLYNQCVSLASQASNNIAVACSISGGGAKWSQWGANTNSRDGCHF